jgi:hypothetical protein
MAVQQVKLKNEMEEVATKGRMRKGSGNGEWGLVQCEARHVAGDSLERVTRVSLQSLR